MKMTKNWIAVAVILLFVGGIVAAIGFAMSGFSFERLNGDKSPRTFRSWEVENFTSVEVDAALADVVVLGGDSAQGMVKGVEEHCTVQVDNGVLRISQNYPNRKWYQLFNFGFYEDENIQLVLPKGFSGAVKVENSSGEIDVEALGKIEALDCKSALGDINVSGVQADTIQLKSNSGAIDAEQIQSKSLVLKADLGDCSVTDAIFDTIETKIQSGDSYFGTVTTKSLDAYSALGRIEFENLRADNIKAKAQSGDISGTIDGVQQDYTIEIDKALGDSNLNNQTGTDKKLDVEVALGDIDIEFMS